jgi:hypothetical protein
VKLPRRKFLHLAAGAAALPAVGFSLVFVGLMLAIRPAPAEIVDGLPDEMIGTWLQCKETENQEIFIRVEDYWAKQPNDECSEGGTVHFWQTGNSGSGRGYCEFDKIEKMTSSVYRVHAVCHGQSGIPETEHWTEHFELEIIDGFLVATDVSEG